MSSILALFFIFGIWSFLYVNNIWFKFVTQTFVAFTAAHYLVTATIFLQSNTITPLMAGQIVLLIPLIIGLLTLSRLSKTYGWINMYPVALMIGVGLGLNLRSTSQSLIVNISSTILPLTSIDNIIIIICAITPILYFIFTRREKGMLEIPTKIGRYAMMLYFGALYANYGNSRFTYLLNAIQRVCAALGLYTL
jgi:hypothetical protein